MPDSGNQLWPRLFCLPTGDRGPEQTSPISRVPYQAARRTVFTFADSTRQQLSPWPRSPVLINVSLKARQINRPGSTILLMTVSQSNSPLPLGGGSKEHPRRHAVMMVEMTCIMVAGRLVRCAASWWTSVWMGRGTKLGLVLWNPGISLVLSSAIAQRWPFAGPGFSV